MEAFTELRPASNPGSTGEPRRPYVGAHPFREADRLYFFGRDREAVCLANLVASGTLTVVYGESGVGKTSLLNAKLSNELERIEPDWRVVLFSEWQPGFEPKLYEAASRVARKLIAPGDLARDFLGMARDTGDPIVVVLDQFEEYFLYQPDGREEFEVQLAALCKIRRSNVRVVLSLRSDGLFLLDRLRTDIPDIYRSLMLVEPLTREGAVAAVVRPLEVYNAQCGPDTPRIEVPPRDSPVVEALVRGSEQGESSVV